jgi:hypothetical protein
LLQSIPPSLGNRTWLQAQKLRHLKGCQQVDDIQMTLHCHPPLTSPPLALPICHSLTPRETCGDEMSSVLLWSWCHSQALMCKTKLAFFVEKLQLSIPTSWTPSSKASRQAPSQFSHFCCFLNFTQFSKDSIFAKFSQHPFLLPPPPCCFLSFCISRLPTLCKCFLKCYSKFMNSHFMNS